MDHETKIEVEAAYWLTVPHVCTRCQVESPVTILVVTEGFEWWGELCSPIDEPSFVTDIDCDLPLEVVRERWGVNPNLGMPTGDERTFSALANVCQHCGYPVDDVWLAEPDGPFLPRDGAGVERITAVPLKHLPFEATEAQICDGDGLPAVLRRILARG